MNDFWNTRYAAEAYAYGMDPNEFFKSTIDALRPSGRILLPAEGEGRNAVYAARKGMEVYAYDLSEEGKNKALQLAEIEGVDLSYTVGPLDALKLDDAQFDVVALIYAHMPADIWRTEYINIAKLLKAGGLLILEGFSRSHPDYQKVYPGIGGPKDIEMLFTVESIAKVFADFEVQLLEEVEVELAEGLYHNGRGKVVRFIGKKN